MEQYNTAYIDQEPTRRNFSDVQMDMMASVFHKRSNMDLESFKRSVIAMENTLAGIFDEDAEIQLNALDMRTRVLREDDDINMSDEQIDYFYFDEKHKALCGLIARFNRGPLKIKEYLDNSTFIQKVLYEIVNHVGQNIFITGQQGSGKSYSALGMCIELCRNTGFKFSLDNVVFNIPEFFRIYNDKTKSPPGSFIVFEEIGVNADSRDALKKVNKILMKVAQTVRYREIALFFNAPDLSFADTKLRKSFHWYLEAQRYDKKSKRGILKPFKVDVKQRSGKIHYVYPINPAGQQVNRLYVPEIPEEIAKAYEKKQRLYKDNLAKEAEAEINMEYDKAAIKDFEKDTLKEIQEEKLK